MLKIKDLQIRALRKLSQNFLVNEEIAERIINYANLKKDDVILEVGTGFGILTNRISEKVKKVYTIEKDKKIAELFLKNKPSNVELIIGDALKVEFPKFNKVISNLPFSISSEITFKILNYEFEFGILTYQKEFGERLVAKRGKDYGRLTVNVYYKAECKILDFVAKENFYPIPKVDAAIIFLRKRKAFVVKNEDLFFKIVDIIFSQRRKKIKNVLINNYKAFTKNKEKMLSVVKKLKDREKRAEELSPEEIAKMSEEVELLFH